MPQAIAPARKLLLRVMLTSLALAAAAGVLGVLIPGKDVVEKLIWTAGLTAVGCALMLAVSRFIEKPDMRPGSLAAMGLILVEYLAALTLVWGIAEHLLGGDEYVGETMGCLAAIGIPAIPFLRMYVKPMMRIAALVGLILLAVEFVAMLAGIWLPGKISDQGDLLGTAFSAEAFTLAVVVSLIGLERGDRRWWRWIGVAAAVAGTVGSALAIFSTDSSKVRESFITWSASLAVVIAHANLSFYAVLTPATRWLRSATIATLVIAAALIGLQVQKGWDSEIAQRITAAAGICAACGSMAMAIISRLNKKTERQMVAPAEVKAIELTCPGCQKRQTLPLGDSACAECGLRFAIKIDEPRCENCGYLLYRLKSDKCPECGTAIVGA